MFAVLKTGGKQYKVAVDDTIAVERLAANAGDTVQFNDVLMLGGETVTVGAPTIDDAAVQAEVLEQFRGEKTISFKKRRRKHSSQRKKGHRQSLTRIKVTDILASGAASSGVMAAVGGALAASAVAVEAAKPALDKEKPAPKAKAAPAPAAPEPAAPAEDAAASGTQPGNLLTEARGTADDLKKISGVGPKLEGTLNSIGVYHFWQIAEWGPAEIAFMDDKLSFKGRIERDNWIDQAKAFAAEAGE